MQFIKDQIKNLGRVYRAKVMDMTELQAGMFLIGIVAATAVVIWIARAIF